MLKPKKKGIVRVNKNIDEMTLGELKAAAQKVIQGFEETSTPEGYIPVPSGSHPMLGKRCMIRTYTAGVHIGKVVAVDGMEVLLHDALRLWKWEGGGLSLSVLASEGIVKGRLNKTGTIYLTQCVEFIPTTSKAEKTFEKFTEK